MLGRDDEVQCLLGRLFEVRVLRHPVGFAQGQRGQRVTVQPDALIGRFIHRQEQVAVGLLALEQIVDAAAHDVGVLVLAVAVARALEGQQGQGGRPGVRHQRCRLAGDALQAPTAVGRLLPHQEIQPQVDRLFGQRRRAASTLAPAAFRASRPAASERFGGHDRRGAGGRQAAHLVPDKPRGVQRNLHAVADGPAVVQADVDGRSRAQPTGAFDGVEVDGQAAFGRLTGHVHIAERVAGAVVGVRIRIGRERTAAGHVDHGDFDGTGWQRGAFRPFQRCAEVGHLPQGGPVRRAGRCQAGSGRHAGRSGDGHIDRRLTGHRSDRSQAGRSNSAGRQIAGFAARGGQWPPIVGAAGLRHAGQRYRLGPDVGRQAGTDRSASGRGGSAAQFGLADSAFGRLGPLVLGCGQQFTAAGGRGRGWHVKIRRRARHRSAAASQSDGAGRQRIGVRASDRRTGKAAAGEQFAGRRSGDRCGSQACQGSPRSVTATAPGQVGATAHRRPRRADRRPPRWRRPRSRRQPCD